jgi:hypothetical protein
MFQGTFAPKRRLATDDHLEAYAKDRLAIQSRLYGQSSHVTDGAEVVIMRSCPFLILARHWLNG